MKEKWVKPKLIVLARGKPEENLLQYCKTYDHGGAIGEDYDCSADLRPQGGCYTCDSGGGS